MSCLFCFGYCLKLNFINLAFCSLNALVCTWRHVYKFFTQNKFMDRVIFGGYQPQWLRNDCSFFGENNEFWFNFDVVNILSSSQCAHSHFVSQPFFAKMSPIFHYVLLIPSSFRQLTFWHFGTMSLQPILRESYRN